MTTKTPVSILQEMCVKTGRCPHYTLTVNGSGTHQCFFQYEVEVGDTKGKILWEYVKIIHIPRTVRCTALNFGSCKVTNKMTGKEIM